MLKLIAFILILLSLNSFSQTLNYKIILNKNEVGLFIINRIIDNGVVEIQAESRTSLHIFKTIEISYTLESKYKDGFLEFCSINTYVNNQIYSSVNTERTGDKYRINKDGKITEFLDDILYSGSLMYYKEPLTEIKMYSEFNSIVKKINKVEAHKYEIIDMENGNKNIYFYKDGILERALIPHTFSTFELIRKY